MQLTVLITLQPILCHAVQKKETSGNPSLTIKKAALGKVSMEFSHAIGSKEETDPDAYQ